MKNIMLFALVACCLAPVSCLAAKHQSNLPVIGAVETLTLVKEHLQFAARIDTGAQTSSLSAVGIQPYERDGKRWIRFQVTDSSGKLVPLERPLARTAKIKRHGALASERPVVTLDVAIGEIRKSCEFTLVDRSDYEYPALVGRNFLNRRALVDVSVEYMAHPLSQGEKKDAN